MPQDILEAFQSFAETTIEVERKYQNLSQKIADHLWSERNDVVDFDKRVAPYGEVYMCLLPHFTEVSQILPTPMMRRAPFLEIFLPTMKSIKGTKNQKLNAFGTGKQVLYYVFISYFHC